MHVNKSTVFLTVALSVLLLGCQQARGQSSLPSGWLDQDIGTVGTAGSASYTSGVFTVAGGGSSLISTTTDAFHFAYQPLSGDGTIVARVVSVNSRAQAGVMIRETLSSGAAEMAVVDYPYYGAIEGIYRTTGNSSNYAGVSAGVPYWVKLVRAGSTFTGYVAADGVNWVQVGASQTVNMAQNVYVGLEVAGSTSTAYTATFDNVSVSATANPAPQITGVSATTGSVGEQIMISGSGFGASQGNRLVTLGGVSVTVNSWSDSSITFTIPTGATSGYLVVSVAPSMNDSNVVDFTVTANPLPAGWLDQDVGVVGTAGSASYGSGVFTVAGGGSSLISTTTDAFHFAYQPLSGDGTIVARVVSVNSRAQAGVMIRETLSSGAAEMAVADYPYYGASEGIYRTTGNSSNYAGVSAGVPYWVKLVRAGSTFTRYVAADGVNWVQVGASQTVNMAQNVYVGLEVAGSTSTAYTATFDNVSVSATANPAPQITGVSATTGSVGQQVVISGTGFGASQGSSLVTLAGSSMTVRRRK